MDEGSSALFTLATTNVAAGSQYSYSISGVSASDVTGGSLTGTVTIGADGKALIPVSLVADASTEGTETLTVTIADKAASVTVVDTSLTPAPTPRIMALGTGVDTGAGFTGAATNDIFNASLSGAIATLNNLDALDGGDGTDTLNVELNGVVVTPTALTSIEQINVTSTAANSNLDLTNATGVTNITSSASANTLTLSNIQSTATSVTISNSTFAHTINFAAAAVAGAADTASVSLNNVTGDPLLTIGAGVETLALNVAGTNDVDTAFAGAVTVVGAGTLTLTAAADAVLGATTVDASLNSGGITFAMSNAAHTVTGGSGADNITGATGTANRLFGGDGNNTIVGGTGADSITAGTGNDQITTGGGADTVDAGTGNDRFIFAAAGDLTVADTIAAGTGTDTLVVTNDDIVTNAALLDTADLRALQAGMADFETVEISNAIGAGAASVIDRMGANINRVDLTAANAGAATVTLNAGANTLNLNVAGVALPVALFTVQDNGTATTDTLTLVNANANATDRFGGAAGSTMSILGFETLNINTGAAGATLQTTGAITFTADGTNTASSINVTGTNRFTLGAVTTTGTGLLSINASGMTAQVAGTTTITVTAPVTTGGTVNITGSAGQDVLNGDATDRNTIDGGAGVDTINGGTAADSLTGGDGNDTIATGGGNDTVSGGAGTDSITGGAGNEVLAGNDGNDTIIAGAGNDNIDGGAGDDIVTVDVNLASADTVVGGEGTDTLVIGQAVTAADASQTSGFEVLRATATVTQDLFNLVLGNTLTAVEFTADADMTFTNAAATTNTVTFGVATTVGTFDLSYDRLIDNASNSLTVNRSVDADVGAATLTVDDEESLTISTAATAVRTFTITDLIAADLTSLTVTGNGNISIPTITGATALATLVASNTGTVVIGSVGNASTTAMSVTTGTGAATVTGGTGADTMTAGSGAVVFSGANGNDVLTGGVGADSLAGGAGNGNLSGGDAADSLLGGGGNDTLSGGAGADRFQFTARTDGTDVISDFTRGTDLIEIADAIINPAVTANGAAYAAGDYQVRATVADILVADTLKIVELSTAQSTAQLQTVAATTGGLTPAVVVVFNSTTGRGEMWFDSDWRDAVDRVQLATFDNIVTLTGITDLTEASFINIA